MVGYEIQIYEIKFESAAGKELSKLPNAHQLSIVEKIKALKYEPRPHGCKKLKGHNRMYRIRIGNYRVIYDIYDNVLTVLVLHIGHRKDVYRK